MATPRRTPRAGYVRVSGTLAMVVLVVSGMGAGAIYYSWKEPRVRAAYQKDIASAPTTQEGRVDKWLEHGTPQVHHNLSTFARVSAEHPWIVTHTVEAEDGGAPFVHGVDVQDLSHDLLRREGLTVVLQLDAPRMLGRARLGGDSAEHIPHYRAEVPQDVADARLREIVEFLLADLVKALEKDIEGASLEVRIGG